MDRNDEGEKLYKQIFEEAKNDQNILGLILTAGRGKGLITKYSDYDVFLIISDQKIEEYKNKYKELKINEVFDLVIMSLPEFKKYAEMGSETEWDRYNFAHIKAQIDRGEIQELIDEKGVLPENKIKEVVENNLDSYINFYYRSLKENRDGDDFAGHLDAVESIPYLLRALFGMNGRIRPYNKYFEWELEKYPLEKTAWKNEEFMEMIKAILMSGNIEVQKKLYKSAKELFYKNGFTKSIDGWSGYYL